MDRRASGIAKRFVAPDARVAEAAAHACGAGYAISAGAARCGTYDTACTEVVIDNYLALGACN
ncbi:hypothetical protein OG782_31200 [Streptomyces sp. NBC_00876]|uniref:hypothetical protein n=1 Tax=Streptomyces sp. NBC_00876 TaxID=2975853 RepID=UPI003865B360|nr:hypothetical protein OG782_31200 [Streptomyces sp. NBC_00876]